MAWSCFQPDLTKKLPARIKYLAIIAAFFLICYLTGSVLSYSTDPVTTNKAIGINLAGIKDWSSDLVFNNYFKRARPWINHNSKNPLVLDEHGWVKKLNPDQSAQTYIFAGFQSHFPSMEFSCLYDGSGIIEFPEATVTQKKHGLYRIKLNTNASNLSIVIRKTNPKNYIRNIRIYFGNNIEGKTFRPDFLKRWQSFSAIRFMGWMETNDSNQVDWNDRPLPEYFSQATHKGVALEYMIELANRLNISPWFCMPHQASDDYIIQFARMVKKQLNPKLKIYIEYSNEVWNPSFKQYQYARRKGMELNLSNKPYLVPIRYYSQRSTETFRIWESVFHGHKRLVRVLSGQMVVPYMTAQILDWKNAWKQADAYAVGDYFGMQNKALLKQTHPDLKELNRLMWLDLDKKKELEQQHQAIVSAKKLKLFAYEGGQHLVARNNPVLNKLFDQANRSNQMNDLYARHLENWFDSGGALFMHFGSVSRNSKYGKWGALEWYDQNPANTKYAVLLKTQRKTSTKP